ncbi:hypothetical protein HLV38_05890 [Berryella wangjianweii]|uniref:Chaperone TorD involved in molybdoenzyme TorA maturation n=1 Tax=Berryella wangjianweii TaxID=2734634 RepID=A0A6M8JA36_9ACTN|nr:molecular chaperone TorD family protein [Berryella wangjianweii]QKF07692.1 hypothetical protein HLV38_05890 [Berryella wangjianweii]
MHATASKAVQATCDHAPLPSSAQAADPTRSTAAIPPHANAGARQGLADTRIDRGIAALYDTLAAALLRTPDAPIAADVYQAAELLGRPFPHGGGEAPGESGEEKPIERESLGRHARRPEPSAPPADQPTDLTWLEQRFYDRFLVPTTGVFIPLAEGCVTGAETAGAHGRIAWGPREGRLTAHVRTLYDQAGFQPASLTHSLAPSAMRDDFLGCELAFLAFLRHPGASEGTARGDQDARDRFAHAFLRRHGAWFDRAADLMEAQDDDFYARVVRLAALVARADLQLLDERITPPTP